PGEYSVLIFSTNCNKRSDPFLITALEDLPGRTVVKAYPNPTSEVLQVESSLPIVTSSLMDATGREWKVALDQTSPERYKLGVSVVPSGLYILKIATSEKVSLLKIIIRH
ncbi:MAG: T9SS type A sorting domain-containing protein, partial [Bacteroidetes bacterium]|nr:T9SS type A sorting domain-containing protein [Bacteroidota bacterium]